MRFSLRALPLGAFLARLFLGLALAWPALAMPLERVAPAPLVFIEPVLDETEQVATVTENGQELLVFREVEPGAEGSDLRQELTASPVVGTVARLYTVARDVLAGLKVPTSGPVAVHVYAGEMFGSVGPAHAARRIRLRRASGVEETPAGFIILSDIDAGSWRLSVADMRREKFLAMTLAHEIGHAMMADAYAGSVDLRALSVSRTGHDVMAITDPQMALHEGWAEALEAYIGDSLAARKVTGWGEGSGDPTVRAMFRGRQDILRADQYIWERVGARDGETRNGLQMMASEGVAAYQLWQVLSHRDFSGPELLEGFRRVIATLARHKPRDVGGLMQALAADWPAHRPMLARMLYEWTKWVPYSPAGGELYKKYWVAQQAAKRHQIADETAKELARELAEARAAYDKFKEAAFREVLARTSLAPALADPLWIDSGRKRLGLNLATADELSEFLTRLGGESAAALTVAQQLTERRDSSGGGYFRQVEELAPLVGEKLAAALKSAREEFSRSVESQAAQASLAAYLAAHPDRILRGRLARWHREARGR